MDRTTERLPRSSPEEQGISSAALITFVEEATQTIDALHSVMLVRHAHVVTEGWWLPYAADEPHAVYSISKSFTSTVIGIAAAEGRLSIDDPVLKFSPEQVPSTASSNLTAMPVRDLLRLTTGRLAEDLGDFPYRDKTDLVKAFLEIPVAYKPGTQFAYDEPGVYVLSAIIQKTTGHTLLDYLRSRLFEPLGISDPTWWASSQGISLGASGLSIRTEDIAKFGQLYLQRGHWQGRQLIPSAWVDAATSLQTPTGSDPNSDWDQGYGYLFWRFRHGFYGGVGLLRQFCIVMPEFDAVIAITSAVSDPQSLINLIWNKITPAFKDQALPADARSYRRLSERLTSLLLKIPAGNESSRVAGQVAGIRYRFPDNPQRIEFVEFETVRDGTNAGIVFSVAAHTQRIEFGKGNWLRRTLSTDCGSLVPMSGYLGGDSGDAIPIASSGAWVSDDTYTAILCRYQTAFSSTYDMRFAGDELILERKQAVTERTGWVRLIGKA